MKQFEGKLTLITGGSSGIGLALAKDLASRGANVCILARDPRKLDAACAEIRSLAPSSSQMVLTLSVDITREDQIRSTLQEFAQRYGTPDLLINSAGIAQPGCFTGLDSGVFRAMMDVNYFGTLYTIQSLLPGMIARGSGHIVNLSSVAGILGVYGYSAYGPTKFAIRGLSDTLRYELAEHGIRVSVVFPPDTQTPQLDYENQYKPPILVELDKNNKVLSAETVAKSILKGVARGQYIITPGFDSTLYYQLTNFFGLVYPVMEFMVAQARRAIRAGAHGNGAAKNNGRH